MASNDSIAAQLRQVRDSLAQQRARADQESRRAKEEMVSAQIRAAELAQKANAQAQKTLEKAKTDAEQLLQDAGAKASVRMEQANEQAELIVARAHSEKSQMRDMVARSADDIAASVKVLKAQLAAVDEKKLLQRPMICSAPRMVLLRLCQMQSVVCRRLALK